MLATRGYAMDLLRPSCSGVKNELPPPASCYDAGVATVADAKFSPVRTYVPTYSDYSDYSDSEEECTSEEDEDLSISRPAPALRKLPFQDEVLSFRDSCSEESRRNRGKVNQWVATWKEESDEDGRRSWTWIHVYAYYSKKKLHGGYGVILLDALGNPITAAANFSETGVSFYYQVFKGIDAGVTLAERHSLSDHLRVQCNSSLCRNANDLKGVCDRCKGCFSTRCCGTCEMVVPLVLKLRHKNYPRELSSTWDLAAHYVARI